MEARFYRSEGQDAICGLCPRRCRIAPGGRGACLARINRAGTLFSAVYGVPAAVQIDPIEKKPFANFDMNMLFFKENISQILTILIMHNNFWSSCELLFFIVLIFMHIYLGEFPT